MHTQRLVRWTETERQSLANSAAEIQEERPDLSGLGLLRAAIRQLPDKRQRCLVSLAQAEWFEPMLEAATRLRRAEARVPIEEQTEVLKEGVETYRTLNAEVSAFNARYLKLNEDKLRSTIDLVRLNERKLLVESDQTAAQIRFFSEERKHKASDSSMLAEIRNSNEAIKVASELIRDSLANMSGDTLNITRILKAILDEVTTLKHLAIGIPSMAETVPPAEDGCECDNLPMAYDGNAVMARRDRNKFHDDF